MSSSPALAKVYYTNTSCGFATFLAAELGNVKVESEIVDLSTHKTASGADFYKINPKGNVPCVVLPDGTVLNEGAATLQWVADQAPNSGLAPANGTSARYKLIALLNYIASEVHTNIGGLFNPTLHEEHKKELKARAIKKFDYITEQELNGGKKFLTGDAFTVADCYLYVVLTWCKYVGVSYDNHPVIKAYVERVSELEGVKKAHEKANAAAAAAKK